MTMGKKYSFSKYVFIFNYTKDESIVYSSRTGGLFIIENSKLARIQNDQEPDYDLVNQLILHKILVDSSINETNEILALQKKKICTDRIFKVAIVPTYKCNFSCDYCFVSDKDGDLAVEEFDIILQYLRKQIDRFNFNEIYLDWFGGEPLLAKNKIHTFMRNLESLVNIKIDSTLVTNGYLLTPEVVKDLVKVNVTTFQITFDGSKDLHNEYRKGKNDKNTYDRILKNIEEITTTNTPCKLDIRCNFHKNSKEEALEFILFISEKYRKDPRVNINLKPVIDFNIREGSCAFDGYGDVARFKNEVIYSLLNNKIRYNLALPRPKFWWCNAGFDSSVNIGPGCKLYACRSEFGNPHKSIGVLDAAGDANYNDNYSRWQDKELILHNQKCFECNILPICMGSCKALRFSQNQNLCYWDRDSLEQYIRMWVGINVNN